MVGADGLNSVVRTCAGIGFTGASYDASFVLADIQLDWQLSTDEVQLFLSPAGLVVVAPLPGGRHRVVATMDHAPETPSAELIQSLLDERGPGDAHVGDVAWSSRFRVQHRVADHYRRDSLLLAGDAAHVHSPAGGQGMNTGIQDAIDLGYTLVDVITGQAAPTALDGYQERRRPIALQVVDLTDRATRLATATAPPHAPLGTWPSPSEAASPRFDDASLSKSPNSPTLHGPSTARRGRQISTSTGRNRTTPACDRPARSHVEVDHRVSVPGTGIGLGGRRYVTTPARSTASGGLLPLRKPGPSSS